MAPAGVVNEPAATATATVTGAVTGGRVSAAPRRGASGPPIELGWRAEAVVEAAWGAAPGELGRRRGGDVAPEGPMSFVVGAEGEAVILDQVNGRAQIFGADGPRVVPLPGETFEDLASAGEGLVVLDRHTRGALLAVAGDGRVEVEAPLRGAGVDEPGEVTGLFQRADGSWVEVGHRALVQVLGADGQAPASRLILDGRPHPDGRLLQAARAGEARAVVSASAGDGEPSTVLAFADFDIPLWQLTALEVAGDGRIFLGVDLVDEEPAPPYALREHREEVVVLAADGGELGRLELRASEAPEETLQRIRVAPDGSVYQMWFGPRGVSVWRYVP